MARLAVTLTLIFSLFLLSQARVQPSEWNPLISSDLPDSASELAVIPSNHLIDSVTEPKLLLPSERPQEDSVSEIAEFESTDAAAELPASDDVAVATSIDEEVQLHKKHKKHGFHFRFPFGFHKRSHKKDKQHKEQEEKEVAEFESTDGAELMSETSISSINDEENHHHHHKKHMKYCLHFQFRFPFLFRRKCHHHHQKNHTECHHHHHHKNHSECHHHHHKNHTDCHQHHKNHTDCHLHHKNHSHWEKEEKEMAREEIPSGDKAEMTDLLLHGDGTEGMIRSEEGKIKHHHKKERKMKKHNKKVGKKVKKHGGLVKFFHKLFKHFH